MTENRPGRPGDVDATASSPAAGESRSLREMLSDARGQAKGHGVVQGSTVFFKNLAESIGHSNRNLKIGLAFLTAAFVVVAAALGTLVFGFLVYAGWPNMMEGWRIGEFEGELPVRVPTYPVRTILILGAGLTGCEFVLYGWRSLRLALKRTGGEEE